MSNLDKETNYIVSGLERSGTSLMMQILDSNLIPLGYDDSRLPDGNNPNGYYELEGGKIIDKLRDGTFDLSKYNGMFIKITCYGLRHLPDGKYKIIFMTRNIDEIVDSSHLMYDADFDKETTKNLLEKVLTLEKKHIKERNDIKVLYVNYNNLLNNPDVELIRVKRFLGDFDVEKGKSVIDDRLYRSRR